MNRAFGSDETDYRCAPNADDCVDDISPNYHSSDTTYSSNNQIFCYAGVSYRCSTTTDIWVDMDGWYGCAQKNVGGSTKTCRDGASFPYWGAIGGEQCGGGSCEYDNDCDGKYDYIDPDCVEGNPSSPTNTPLCDDGRDNDCDASTDWNDAGCCKKVGQVCSSDTSHSECCGYTGNVEDYYCKYDDGDYVCGTSDDCNPACDSGYWTVECLLGEDLSCCSASYWGVSGMSGGWEDDGVTVIW